MKKKEYQICTKCIMDTTDPDISFDDYGVCNHCLNFEAVTKKEWFPNKEGEKKLQSILNIVKKEGQSKEYDCIIGLSGGIDSSYLALKAYEWGLRPLVVHVDAGWNSELAVSNIEKIVKYCKFDLHTHVMNWEDMKNLQLAYLKAAIANQDVPQDHAFFASMYHFAVKNKIKFILTGGNIATESIFPKAWHHSAMDAISLKAINRKFGNGKLQEYKTISFFKYYFYYPFIKKMRTFRPLNFIPFNKDLAIKELKEKIGWKAYGRKHGESRFTKFFQNYYLPKKFGYDKRRPHYSSLIVSGQLTRAKALEEVSQPLYRPEELSEDKEYFAKKLGISLKTLESLMDAKIHTEKDFPNFLQKQKAIKFVQRLFQVVFRKKINVYS